MNCVFTDDPENYEMTYECPDCGFDERDSYADIYGCMSVPWGFLL